VGVPDLEELSRFDRVEAKGRCSQDGPEQRHERESAAVPVEGQMEALRTTGGVGGHVPPRSSLIEYPFPLRPGVQARLALPEDLTEREAKRLARFVESLAVSEQPAITGRVAQQ
jgi:hypothetical protein